MKNICRRMVVMVEQQSECMQGNGILYLKIVTKVKLMYINLLPPKKKEFQVRLREGIWIKTNRNC